MQQLFKLSAAPMAGLWAMALVAAATPASAAEYCRQDAISGMRSCSFATLEQCQAMSSGLGGTCYRDPFLPQASASSAYAYAPLHGGKRATKPAAKSLKLDHVIERAQASQSAGGRHDKLH